MYLRGMKRSTQVSAGLVAVIDLVLVAVIVGALFNGTTNNAVLTAKNGDESHVASRPVGTGKKGVTTPTSSVNQRNEFHPLRVSPPETAIQQSVSEALAQSSGQGDISTLESAACPTVSASAPFPAINIADSSSASLYALAFTQELLDLHFAASNRSQLLAWANYNNAPYSLGDLSESLSTKVLCSSLESTTSPIPVASLWADLAKSHVSWNVSGLVVSVNPTWTQALSAGWESVDPLMGIYDVSGSLTISSPGHLPDLKSFSFALSLGGASLHLGYGAVSLNDWTLN